MNQRPCPSPISTTLRERAWQGQIRPRLAGLASVWVLCATLLAACGGGRSDAPAAASAERPTMRALATGTLPAGVLINELVAGSWQGAKDEDGDAEDWVELYNPGETAVDLTGFGLSNKDATRFQWVFPAGTRLSAKGYLRVWLSKKDRTTPGAPLHANFNLDSGDDGVFLTASNGTAAGVLVDSAKPPLVRHDHSWCRMPSGSPLSPFHVCTNATPGAANSGSSFPTILARPTMALPSGFYATAQTLTISGPAGATLRYTTDGSEPTAASTAYTGPLSIANARVVRAAAFANGAAPSLTVTGTFVVDAALVSRYATLNAMLVTIAPDDLAAFEADNKDRRFRASFEYVTGARTRVFGMDGEGVSGGNVGSATSPQRTMNVAGRDAFGAKNFPAVFWADKPQLKSHRKFRLRNGSNDWAAAHMRDQLSQRISADGPNIYASSATVAMFINGRYYAMMDLREREEETMPAANLGIDKDWVDYLTDPLLRNQEIKNGGARALADYRVLHDFVLGNDMAQAGNYARVKTLMNPQSLAWDWAMHMFHANYDWPDNNVHVWRSPEVDGRWTWRPHDMDLAFDAYNFPAFDMNVSFTKPGSEVMNALLRNAEFRSLYLNTVADQLNIMSPAFMEATLDVMAAEMRPYIPDFYARNSMGSPARWEAAIDALRFYFGQREPVYDRHTRSWFGLGPRQPISVAVNDPAMGGVSVNTVATERYMRAGNPVWQGRYFPGVPITLEAKPKPGFVFVGWQGASSSSSRVITQTLAAPANTGFPADNFSVRWQGSIEAPVSGNARLQVVADDGVRVWFDGVQVINGWVDQSATTYNADVTLVAGRRHALLVEYYESGADARIQLNWRLPGSTAYVSVMKERLYPQGAAASAPATGTGLRGQYFANRSLSGTPAFERIEPINHDWQTTAPAPTAAPVALRAVFAPGPAPAAPVLSAVAAQAWRTGDTVRVQLNATDPGSYPLTYAATGLPKGLSLNPKTGVVYGRLTTPGSSTSILSAGNGASSTSIAVSWTVRDRPGSGLLGTSPGWSTTPPPNQAPTVALTSPGAGSGFTSGGTITLLASAADSDGSVVRVEFYDGNTLIGSDTTAPYSLNWTGAAIGSHSLSARAIDNAGASSRSAAVGIRVNAPGNRSPLVSITSPSGNASYAQGSLITLRANASDPDGSVASVAWYDGSTLLTTLTTSPYTISSGIVSLGTHVVTAVATDNQGATTRSAPVTITVVPPTGGGGSGGAGKGLRGSYYANRQLAGTPVLERTESVNFDWGAGAPAASVPADFFSARWRGFIEAPTSGTYQIQTNSDDGVRVWINGRLVIDNWSPHGPTLDTSPSLSAAAGQRYPIVVEYRELSGGATIQLRWKKPGDAGFSTVPADRLFPP